MYTHMMLEHVSKKQKKRKRVVAPVTLAFGEFLAVGAGTFISFKRRSSKLDCTEPILSFRRGARATRDGARRFGLGGGHVLRKCRAARAAGRVEFPHRIA